MYLATDFDVMADQEAVYRIMGIREDSEGHRQADSMYPQLHEKARQLAVPRAYFDVQKMQGPYRMREAAGCTHMIPCLITIGEQIGTEINDYMSQKKYLEGYLLDTIANQMLTGISTQLHHKISEKVTENKLGMTRRISPGDDGIPMRLQKSLLTILGGEETLKVEITGGYMLNPVKFMAYYYGADQQCQNSSVDHDCHICTQDGCQHVKQQTVIIDVQQGHQHRKLVVPAGQNLYESLKSNGFVLDSPCNGMGFCGKCKVIVLQGNELPGPDESKYLTESELQQGVRLACRVHPLKNLRIEIPSGKSDGYQILSHFNGSERDDIPLVTIRTVTLQKPELKNQHSLEELIQQQLGYPAKLNLRSALKLATAANQDFSRQDHFSLSGDRQCNVVLRHQEIIDIMKADDFSAYGIAMDIGTTTIAVSLTDIHRKKSIGSVVMLNPQRQFGADVITRIQHSITHGIQPLRDCLRTDIEKGIRKLCAAHDISTDRIDDMVVSGNTTMAYTLLGMPVQSLAASPFTTVTKKWQELKCSDIFPELLPETRLTVLPSVSAYVGGDIVAGMLHCGYHHFDKTAILIDLGTNGEIAILNKDAIYCASTAAGPAFEGASIYNGVGSIPGAICSFTGSEGKTAYKTIGGTAPVGICGSGVIDIVAWLIKEKIMDKTGRFVEETARAEKRVLIAEDAEKPLYFYQKDVREFQLAKSAIRAGLEVVMESCGLQTEAIDEVYLSGGFGSYINKDNAVITGILPAALQGKITTSGNSSLGGAADCLLKAEARNNISRILEKATYIELSSDPSFNQLFIERMGF